MVNTGVVAGVFQTFTFGVLSESPCSTINSRPSGRKAMPTGRVKPVTTSDSVYPSSSVVALIAAGNSAVVSAPMTDPNIIFVLIETVTLLKVSLYFMSID